MQSLGYYMNVAQHDLYKSLGAIFAPTQELFEKNRTENVEYRALASGMYVPVANALSVYESFETILNNAIAMDIAANGKEAIIRRELLSQHCFFDGEVARGINALACYKFPREDIVSVYNTILANEDTTGSVAEYVAKFEYD